MIRTKRCAALLLLLLCLPTLSGCAAFGTHYESLESLRVVQTLGVDVRSHIEEISVATPVTFARYLGTPEGTIYGYKTSDWDNVVMRTQCEAREYTIPGLSFVGGHSVMGDGFSCAYMTGSDVGKRIVKKIKEGGNK